MSHHFADIANTELPLAELFVRIDESAEAVECEKPPALTRRRLRRRATGAAMAHLAECHEKGVEPTEESLQEAIDKEFYSDTFEEVGSVWLSLLLPVLIRLVLEWWLVRKQG